MDTDLDTFFMRKNEKFGCCVNKKNANSLKISVFIRFVILKSGPDGSQHTLLNPFQITALIK